MNATTTDERRKKARHNLLNHLNLTEQDPVPPAEFKDFINKKIAEREAAILSGPGTDSEKQIQLEELYEPPPSLYDITELYNQYREEIFYPPEDPERDLEFVEMGDEYGEPDDEVTVLADGDSPPHDLKRRELLNSGWEYEGVWDEGLSVFIVRVESFVDLRVHLDNMPPSRHRVNVVVEMSPEGERHPHVWAQKALDGDPGARLAFRLDVPKKHMMDSAFYPKSTTFEDARKANSFMDWMSGVPDKVLLERPRRYVLFSGHCEDDLPAGVSGPGAYFTDDDCKLHRYGSMKRYAQVGAGEPDAKRRMLTR